MYTWKVISGKTHNFGLRWNSHPTRGVLVNIKLPGGPKVTNRALNIWRQTQCMDYSLKSGIILLRCTHIVDNFTLILESGSQIEITHTDDGYSVQWCIVNYNTKF